MNLGTARAEKACARCEEFKPASEFSRVKSTGQLRPYCRGCDVQIALEWQRANPERHAANKHASFVKNSKRFSVWKLDGTVDGICRPYLRAIYKDPCAYCGGPGGEADHIFPVQEIRPAYGRQIRPMDEWADITAACHRCNVAKNRQTLLEFLGWPEGWLRST